MNINERAKELLQKGNLQEQRNKKFAINYATSLVLILVVGFLAGFSTCKSMMGPINDLAKIAIERNLQTTDKPY